MNTVYTYVQVAVKYTHPMVLTTCWSTGLSTVKWLYISSWAAHFKHSAWRALVEVRSLPRLPVTTGIPNQTFTPLACWKKPVKFGLKEAASWTNKKKIHRDLLFQILLYLGSISPLNSLIGQVSHFCNVCWIFFRYLGGLELHLQKKTPP